MKRLALFAISYILLIGSARAQWGMEGWLGQMTSFDQQFEQQLGSLMAANQAQTQQLLQTVAADPQVQAAYQQYLQSGMPPMSYDEFVYYWVMTAGGTNVQAGLKAQQDWFNGVQDAAGTIQSGYDGYNDGWWNSTTRTDQVMDDYSTYAVQGDAYYNNPYTGETYTLPYTSGPGYYQDGQNTFYMDELGQYWQFVGNDWQPLNPYHP